MNCGVGLTSDALSEWFSFIGLGKEEMVGTPSTVGLEHDEENNNGTGDYDDCENDLPLNRQLHDTFCMPTTSTIGLLQTKARQHPPCTPTTCRMTSGMCIDCARCLKHCICGDKDTNFIPATCDTPACSNIVCGDCLRCQTHCTCHRRSSQLQIDNNSSSVRSITTCQGGGEVRDQSDEYNKSNTGSNSRGVISSPKPPSSTVRARDGTSSHSTTIHQPPEFALRTRSLLSEDSSFNVVEGSSSNSKQHHQQQLIGGSSVQESLPSSVAATEFSYNFLLNNSDENFRVNRILRETSSIEYLSDHSSSHNSHHTEDSGLTIDTPKRRRFGRRARRKKRSGSRSVSSRGSNSIASKLSLSSKGSSSTQGSF